MSRSLTEPPQRYLEKFSYVPLGEMLTLGGPNAALSSLNDGIRLGGPAAAAARRLVYSYRMPTTEQRINAVTSALTSSLVPLITGKRK